VTVENGRLRLKLVQDPRVFTPTRHGPQNGASSGVLVTLAVSFVIVDAATMAITSRARSLPKPAAMN
jgi:hypothetical protein